MTLRFYFSNTTSWYKKLGAWLIQGVEKTSYSHFAIGLDNGKEEIIFESVVPKSRRIKKTEWLRCEEIIKQYTFIVPRTTFYEMDVFLNSQMNKWYSLSQCFWIGVMLIFKIKKWFNRNSIQLNGKHHLICTELGYLFCREFFHKVPNLNEDYFDLKEMQNLITYIIENDVTK